MNPLNYECMLDSEYINCSKDSKLIYSPFINKKDEKSPMDFKPIFW